MKNAFDVEIVISSNMERVFAQAKAVMDQSKISQAPKTMQENMFYYCMTDEDVMALLDYLINQGIPVPLIIPEVRCYSNETQSLARRAHYAHHRQQQEQLMTRAQDVRSVVFQEPVMAS